MLSLEERLLQAADEFEKVASEMEKETSEEKKEETPKKEETKVKDKEAVEKVKEELGVEDDELAEKVASLDPKIQEYIRDLKDSPVDSMGDFSEEGKTASETTEDPFLDFLSTPV